jgi:hypothetical protein
MSIFGGFTLAAKVLQDKTDSEQEQRQSHNLTGENEQEVNMVSVVGDGLDSV